MDKKECNDGCLKRTNRYATGKYKARQKKELEMLQDVKKPKPQQEEIIVRFFFD